MTFALAPGLSRLASISSALNRRDGLLAAVMELMALAGEAEATTLALTFGAKDLSVVFDGRLAQPGAGSDRRGWQPIQVYHLTDRPLLAADGWGAVLEAGAETFPISMTPSRGDVRLSLPYRVQPSPLSDALGVSPLNGALLQRLVAAVAAGGHRGLFFTPELREMQVWVGTECAVRITRADGDWEAGANWRRREIEIRTEGHGGGVRRYCQYEQEHTVSLLVPDGQTALYEAWEDAGLQGRGAIRWPMPAPLAAYVPFELSRAGIGATPQSLASGLAALGDLLAQALSEERDRELAAWLALWPSEHGPDPSHPLSAFLESFWASVVGLPVLPRAGGGWGRLDGEPVYRSLGDTPAPDELHPAFEERFPRVSRRLPWRPPVAPAPRGEEEEVVMTVPEEIALPAPSEATCVIELLRLPFRALKPLQRAGVQTIAQLRAMPEEELQSLKGMTDEACEDVRTALEQFSLDDDDPLASVPIQELHLSRRTTNALTRANIVTLRALMALSDEKLLALGGLGATGLEEIRRALAAFDYQTFIAGVSAAMQRIPVAPRDFGTVEEELAHYLGDLQGREREVLTARYGLRTGRVETLEAVGQRYKVQRERIRQIQTKAERKLTRHRGGLCPITRERALEALAGLGGLATVGDWAAAVERVFPAGDVHLPAVLAWLAEQPPVVASVVLRETPVFVGPPLSAERVAEARVCLEEFWADQRSATWDQLLQAVSPAMPEAVAEGAPAVDTLLRALTFEPLPGVFSKERWDKQDVVYHALQQAGVPLHFEEITRRVQALKPDWEPADLSRAVHAILSRDVMNFVRTGSGIFGLTAWGGMRFSHFREVLLEHLSRHELPVHVDQLCAELAGTYAIKPTSIKWTLNDHPHLFQRFGRAAIYGVAGRRYELPDGALMQALVTALEERPATMAELVARPELAAWSERTIELYLQVSPLFWTTGSFRQCRFALSVEGKRRYDVGDAPAIIAEIFGRLHEPLHWRDVLRMVRATFAYPPGEEPFRRVLVGEEYVSLVDQFVVPRAWLAEPGALHEVDLERFQAIGFTTLGLAPVPDDDTLFEWLSFCHHHRFFYRGAMLFDRLQPSNLPEATRAIALKLGRICQQNGDLSHETAPAEDIPVPIA